MRVLIVEDEPLVAFEIESIVLGRLPEVETVLVGSVQDARRAVENGVDLALLDVDVTNGETYPLAIELKTRSVPFGFISGTERERAPQELSEARFIAKPFSQADVVRMIDGLVAPDEALRR